MNKSCKRLLAFSLAISLFLPFAYTTHDISAASTNVKQSRYEAEISEFPISYQVGLTRIKEHYPNAKFIYYDTDLDWYDDLLQEENELYHGRNLISSSSPSSWKSSDRKSFNPQTGQYIDVEPGWNQASTPVIEYYMDPRNFFNPRDIFQFVSLSFDEGQTAEGTQSVLGSSFMASRTIKDPDGNDISYAEAFYRIGKEYNVSPYLLACRARQEQGGGSALIYGTYPGFEGYYNFFNIGAYGSTTQAIITNGLTYAKNHGWNSHYKSIQGGADMLARSYVDSGKNCLYLHHFNVVANNSHQVSYHPYMGAIQAPYHETTSLAKSYTDPNASYTFVIPVYKNMPESPCDLPKGDGNGNSYLKSLELNGGDVSIGEFSTYKYNYTTTIQNQDNVLMIKAETFDKNSTVFINGTEIQKEGTIIERGLPIKPGFNDVVITIQAENGSCRDYIIEVVNDDGGSHFKYIGKELEPGKTIIKEGTTVADLKSRIKTLNCSLLITNNNGVVKTNEQICASDDVLMMTDKENTIIFSTNFFIPGDVTRDGLITEDDVEIVINHIMEKTTLSPNEQKVADINEDGKVSVADVGMIRMKIKDLQLPEREENVTVSIHTPETIVVDKRSPLTLTASEGTYFAEGFIVYNESVISLPDSEYNSGKIHFIADGSKIIFGNEAQEQIFTTSIIANAIEFKVEIVEAYDYMYNEHIEVNAQSSTSVVKNTEIAASLTLKEQPVDGSKQYNALNLDISNQSYMSIGSIRIELGQFLTDKDGNNECEIRGLAKENSQNIDLYTHKDLVAGTYQTSIKIRYQSYDGTESLMMLPITFTVEEHEHGGWQPNGDIHTLICDDCRINKQEPHVYKKESTNKYTCVECGHIAEYSIELQKPESVVHKATVITPIVKVNGTELSRDEYSISWYVDGVLACEGNDFSYIFKSAGRRTIDCKLTLNDGKTAISSITINTTNANSKIHIKSYDCNSIHVKTQPGFEYRINNGQWQADGKFDNLTPGKEYIITQRNAKTKKDVAFSYVYINHNVNYTDEAISCSSDLTLTGTCSICKNKIKKTIPGTSVSCLFTEYKTVSESTCVKGEMQESSCIYGCGEKSSRELGSIKVHKFEEYVDDNNATCTSAGTKTALCIYGCGTKDIVPMDGESFGHKYEYTSNGDATVEHSGTETGVCSKCGKENKRIAYGTRLQYIENISINMSSAVTKQVGLPDVTTDNTNLVIKNITWSNSGGVTFEGKDNNIVIKPDETYILKSLVLESSAGYTIDKNAEIIINGQQYHGAVEIDNNMMVLTDVGQFKF